MKSRTKTFFRRFIRSEKASALVMVGAGSMALVAAAGVAIDMGRVQVVQSRLSNALDAAGLAAGNAINTANPTTIVNNYFSANFPANYLGSTINTPTVSVNNDNSVLTLDVTGTVPTTFMSLFAINNIPVSAHAQITRSSMGMELVLVLDVTGSMNCPVSGTCPNGNVEQPNSKIAALRAAAADLINILYGNNASIPNMWVGIVPFSQTVKVGTAFASWTTNPSGFTTWGPAPSTWLGCVESRAAGGGDITDDPPTVTPFPRYWSPCNADTGNNDSATNAWYGTNSSTDSNGNPAYRNCTYTGTNTTRYLSSLNSSQGPNKGCSLPPIVPLTAAKNTVQTAISSLTAGGSTLIPLGMAWGWRMLSPRWQTLWTAEMNASGLPLNYKTPLMNKVVILMTDGDNDISWDTYTAYGTPNLTTGPTLGNNACSTSNHSNCTNGEDVLDTRLIDICTAMKAADKNIIIYTIAFGNGINQSSQNMMEACATSTSHFFLSPTSTDLQTAFHQIGDSLANLRISQ